MLTRRFPTSADVRPAGAARLPYRLKRRPEERIRVLGGQMDLVRSSEVFHFVDERIAANQRAIVANHNLHSLHLMRRSVEVRAFFEKADLIEVDSVPIILWARLMGRPSRHFHRCTYLDWREEFWNHAAHKAWRVFLLGGAPGVPERAGQAIRARWSSVRLATHHGYFDADPASADNETVVRLINDFQPEVLLVGMGMPRQELWVLHNQERLAACAIFTVGAAFDYEAGVQTPAPRWLGGFAAEWIFRLLQNPGRMFRRYCLEPWSLGVPALRDVGHAVRERLRPLGRR